MEKFLTVCLVVLSCSFQTVFSTESFKTETFLHPGDAFTGYTLRKSEWSHNFALLPPSPGWTWWGITDRITAEIDAEALLGGVPSFNVRFGAIRKQNYALAVEAMTQYIPYDRDIDYVDDDTLEIVRKGASLFCHLNLSLNPAFAKSLHFHFSGGAMYQEHLEINSTVGERTLFKNSVHPDLSAAIDWRISNGVALIGTFGYGTTFIYVDNVPRKLQSVCTVRWAPFQQSKVGFLRTMRLDGAFIVFHFNDARRTLAGPMAFLYWQWQYKKK